MTDAKATTGYALRSDLPKSQTWLLLRGEADVGHRATGEERLYKPEEG